MTNESLARRLRILRAALGITLAEAEELTGVTRETLGALEHGQRGAYTSTLEKIATGYGTTVSALLEEDPEAALAGSTKAEAPEAGPAKLLENPHVVDWLEGQDAALVLMSDKDFVDHVAEIDDLEGLEDLADELAAEKDRVLTGLDDPDVKTTLFFLTHVHGLPSEAKEERLHEAMRPAREAFKLKAEIRREYLIRELAVSNYSTRLYAEGTISDFLIHPRRAAAMSSEATSKARRELEKARRRALKALREELVGSA
jgi:transcriptional regulator with XRE-family HTH domain